MRPQLALPILTTAALLGACTASPSAPSQAPSRSASATSTTVAATPTPVAVPPPFEVGPAVPALHVPGVEYEQLSSESIDSAYALRWPTIPGASALDERVRAIARARLDAYLADNPAGTGTSAEMHLGGEIVAATQDVVAVRLTISTPRGARSAVEHVTVYGDPRGTWAIDSAELFRADARATIADRATASALAAAHATRSLTAAPERILSDVVLRPDGSMVTVIDEGLLTSLDAAPLSATLTATQISDSLSDRGKAVVAGLGAPSEAVVATASPTTPSPSTASTTTATSVPRPPADVDCAAARCVALTFDDGPSRYTATLLDELSAAGAPATFFVLGQNAQSYPDLVRRAHDAGMAIGNHTWDHRSMTGLDAGRQRTEVDSTQDVLRRLTGSAPTILRPPYGAFDADTRTLGLALVLWDVDTEDWKNLDTAETTRRAVQGARSGSIVLMHDIHRSTVAAVPGIVAALRARGFTLVTVPQLLGATTPGRTYFRR